MASKGQIESLTEETICPICLDFFTDPVSPECGHNFCRSCITRCWEREERNSCPQCKEEFADRTLRVNRALASLSEKLRGLTLTPKEKEIKFHCKEHEEELKLFCETDNKLICVMCAAEREHREHRFLSIQEAVKIYKDRIKSSLDSLTKKKSDFEKMEQQQKEKISGVREQSYSVQSLITSQFDELRQTITEKEQRLLRDLREEEERILNPMEKNLREIQENLNSMQEEISKLQNQMDKHEDVMFLMVTLDVETANPWLEVSEDRKSVRRTGTRRDLPDTGKRFTHSACVLGSEGFTSGRHYWEVEVTRNRWWSLGVAAESVERNEAVTRSPETGFWIVGQIDDEMWALTSPGSRLPARPIPGRVGVYLSYESGTVSFYNAETKSHLHTFTGNKFTGKLYPLFEIGYKNQWLRICSGSAPGL
ncbi:zinc-binding protein A33-like [Hemitrygon akajei]|uniref:zinc-binding protein A33-like n=1 Tax=Hemitrygon akajei TaxID=2704970 RepID=UPI003BF96EBC